MKLPGVQFEGAADVQAMVAGFHLAHERVFAVSEPGQHVECIYWKARATARLPKPARATAAVTGVPPAPVVVRDAWFGGEAPQATPRYDGPALGAGDTLAGPCVIQEPTTTVVVFPGWTARVLSSGDYMLQRETT